MMRPLSGTVRPVTPLVPALLGVLWMGLLGSIALAPEPAQADSVHLPPVREVQLPNGARLLLAEKHDVPFIAFLAYLRGGSLMDPPGKEGTVSLTAEMLRKGAGKRSAQEIAAATDGVGARLSAGGGPDFSWVSGEFLSRDEALMLELLRDILRHPTFPDSEFVKLKQQMIDAVRSVKDNPNSVLGSYALAYFFRDHPYGRPVAGDETTLAKITREDVLAAYRDVYGGDRLILAMVGDFDPRKMEGKLRAALGDWKKAAGTLPVVPDTKHAEGRHVLLIDKPDATQTYFWLGNLGISRADPDRDLVDLANTAFGGRYTSMLNTALRIRLGLTYGARSRLLRLAKPGTLAISSYTKTESTQRAIDLAIETLRQFRAAGVDSTMLTSVKRYLAGLYPADLETEDQIAGTVAELAYRGLPETEVTQYIERITAVPLSALPPVIRRVYPAPEDLTIVMIGNASQIRSIARKYGPVVEVRYDQPLLEAVRAAANARTR